MDISLKPSLIPKARLHLLYEVTKELVQAFSVTYESRAFEIIKKGLLERQIFKRVMIYFLNSSGKKVGEAALSIDWEKHHVFTSTAGKDIFNVDPTKSLHQQISEVLPEIITHVSIMKTNLRVAKTEVWYYLKDDFYLDEVKYKDACRYCGLSMEKQQPPEWEKMDSNKIVLEFTPEDLGEFGLTITHNK